MDFDFLLKVVLVGDASVGKSSLLLRYSDNTFVSKSVPTIGVDFKVKTLTVEGKTVKLQIWDTAGQEKFRNITTSYYRGAHGIILIYDVTNERSFQGVQSWLQEVNRYLGHNRDTRKILIGNKADLEHERRVSAEQGQAFADAHGLPFLETSAKLDHNVEAMFRAIAEAAVRPSIQGTPPIHDRPLPRESKEIIRLQGSSFSSSSSSSSSSPSSPSSPSCCG